MTNEASMNQHQPPLPTEEAGRRLRAYPALVAALQEIAAMADKTLLGGRDESDPMRSFQLGANHAFRQAAEVASDALAAAGEGV